MALIRPVIEFLVVLFFFILLTIWFTWPLSNHITEAFISNPENSDAVQYIWNAWIFKFQLCEGSSPFYTTKILFPEGVNLWMHTYAPSMNLFALPFSNTMLGMNIFLLLQYALSGTGAYYLCKKITAHWLPAILTGLLFAFSSFKLLHTAEHYNLLLTATIPFFILSFLNTFEFTLGKLFPLIKNYYYFALTVLLGIITGFSDYYCTFFLIYFCIIWTMWHYFIPSWNTWSTKKKWIIILIVLTVGHIIAKQLSNLGINDRAGIWWGGDFILFFIPNQSNFIYNSPAIEALRNSFVRYPSSLEFQLFLGLVPICLLLFIFIRVIKNKLPANSGPWLFALLIFIMICLPKLIIAGTGLIYLPNALLHYIPFFNNIRCPTRIQILVSLFIPLCGTWLLYETDNMFLNRYRNIICALLIAGAFIELTPYDQPLLYKKDIPSIMTDVKKIKNNTLLTIPLGVRDGMKEEGATVINDLFYQTVHEKNILGGYISRIPEKTFEQIKSDSIVKQLLVLSTSTSATFKPMDENAKTAFLNTYKIGGILISPAYAHSPAHEYARNLLPANHYTVINKEGWLLYMLH